MATVLLANIAYATYLVCVKHVPYQGYYNYEAIIYNHNNSTIEIDIPLPHDEEIYKDLSVSSWRAYSYTIESSEYGKVLHVETNSTSISISASTSFDKNSKIDPKLSLTTQQGNSAYIRLTTNTSGNVSISLTLSHDWFIGPGIGDGRYGSRSKVEYLTISKESDTQEGFPLDEGWNLAPVTHGERIFSFGD